jgi:hypothetical protein
MFVFIFLGREDSETELGEPCVDYTLRNLWGSDPTPKKCDKNMSWYRLQFAGITAVAPTSCAAVRVQIHGFRV